MTTDPKLSPKEFVLKTIDEFADSYERAWLNILGENRIKAFRWDILQLRLKIEKELTRT